MDLNSSRPAPHSRDLTSRQKGFSNVALISSVLLLILASGGLYWAWDRDYIPGNNRAISAKAMQEAVKLQISLDKRNSYANCVYPRRRNPMKSERRGLPGIASSLQPNLYSRTFLVKSISGQKEKSDESLKEWRFFAKNGLFKHENVYLNTNQGRRNAERFTLTWKGYLEMGIDSYVNECFSFGDRALKRITSFSKLDEKVAGHEAWKVNYETEIVAIPEWAKLEEARKLFYRLKFIDQVEEDSAVLIRGEDEWIVERLAYYQLERSRLDVRNQRDLRRINELLFRTSAPTLENNQAEKALITYIKSDKWRSNLACFPINLAAGGDNRALSKSIPTKSDTVFSAQYYDVDMSERTKYKSHYLSTQLALWNALYNSGFSDITILEKGEYKYSDESISNPDGLNMTLDDEVKSLFRINSSKPCIPIGKFNIDFITARKKGIGSSFIIANGKITETPNWARKLAESLPALKHALNHGVLITGNVSYKKKISNNNPSTIEGEWEVSKLHIHYPKIESHYLPSALQPLMPITLRSWPKIEAPISAQDLSYKRKNTPPISSIYPNRSSKKEKIKTSTQPLSTRIINNRHNVTMTSRLWRSIVRKELVAEYHKAGAATPWTLSKNYSSGRYYFEAHGKTTKLFSFNAHTNITLTNDAHNDHFGDFGIKLIEHGEHALRKKDDIFGVAIDYDKGRLYYHINGVWISGKPDTNLGLRFQRKTMQYPVFVATGNRKGRKGVYWRVNLGRKGFKYDVPVGFKPYGS